MNDAMTAAKESEEKSTDAQDFVELGSVSKDTKGTFWGAELDGGFGWFNG